MVIRLKNKGFAVWQNLFLFIINNSGFFHKNKNFLHKLLHFILNQHFFALKVVKIEQKQSKMTYKNNTNI